MAAMMAHALELMPGIVDPEEMARAAGIGVAESARILDDIADGGHVGMDGKMAYSVMLARSGIPLETISSHLDWRSFEGLAAEVLDACGFEAVRNMRFRKPRMEIDVVGTSPGLAVAVDCKHWDRHSRSALCAAAKRQAARAARYARANSVDTVPVLVTLLDEALFSANVPIVPILRLGSFARELRGNLDSVLVCGAT